MSSQVIALCVADLHFSEKPPVARSVEQNWLGVQEGYINQLRALQQDHIAPILIAGDLFDTWHSSAHIVNHVIRWLWGMEIYAIPGNHEVPHHSYVQMEKSSYYTLVEAGVIKTLTPGGSQSIGQMTVYPYPYGFEIQPPDKDTGLSPKVALIHNFIWTKDTGHPGATEESRWAAWIKKLEGYDIAIFGDNHKSFLALAKGKCSVLNCGSFMRRHTDEREHRPSVGMIHEDLTITRHYLDTSEDQFLDIEGDLGKIKNTLQVDMEGLTGELSNLHSERLDYCAAVLLWMEQNNVPEGIKNVMLRCSGATPNAKRR